MANQKSILENIELSLRIIGILLAGSWAVTTYWYEKKIEPDSHPSFLNISGEVEKVGEKRGQDVYKVTIVFQNKSKVREKIVASWFHLVATNLTAQPYISDASYISFNKQFVDSFYYFSRYTYGSNMTTFETGKLFDEQWLNPEQEIRKEFVTVLPHRKFDNIGMYIYGTTTKDKENKIAVRWVVTPDRGEVIPEYGINLGDSNKENWEYLDAKLHSRYIEKYDILFTRFEKTVYIGKKK